MEAAAAAAAKAKARANARDTAKLTVMVRRARHLEDKAGGQDGEEEGDTNPFCELKVAREKFVTGECQGSCSPDWLKDFHEHGVPEEDDAAAAGDGAGADDAADESDDQKGHQKKNKKKKKKKKPPTPKRRKVPKGKEAHACTLPSCRVAALSFLTSSFPV